MLLYIARRLVWTVVVILAVVAVTFAVFFLLPNGNPALRFCGKAPTKQCITQDDARLHLNKPWYIEFGYFVKTLVSGDAERLAGPRLLVRQLRLGAQRDHPARAADALADRRAPRRSGSPSASRSACSRR